MVPSPQLASLRAHNHPMKHLPTPSQELKPPKRIRLHREERSRIDPVILVVVNRRKDIDTVQRSLGDEAVVSSSAKGRGGVEQFECELRGADPGVLPADDVFSDDGLLEECGLGGVGRWVGTGDA